MSFELDTYYVQQQCIQAVVTSVANLGNTNHRINDSVMLCQRYITNHTTIIIIHIGT